MSPHDFQEVACLRCGTLYIRTGWTLNFFPVQINGLSGFHSSTFLLAKAGALMPNIPPAIPAVVNPTNSLLLMQSQHITTSFSSTIAFFYFLNPLVPNFIEKSNIEAIIYVLWDTKEFLMKVV
jgi:hypothetical protein